ncbi:hypothetical protein LTR17_003276 [Elasticomyces elasticus]|nr:hypothetical protein LTR17_003276 [Elasticomyces elasticus]
MSSTQGTSYTDKHSQSRSKHGFNCLVGKDKPDLAVDTSFIRHQAQPPKQVFPYESKTQELSFISYGGVKALGQSGKGSLKKQLRSKLTARPSTQRSVTEYPANGTRSDVRPTFWRNQTSAAEIKQDAVSQGSGIGPPLHKRIKGLRPSPLDLTQEVSPSDRAITIALDIPSEASVKSRGTQAERRPEDLKTPTIVVTPAEEDFGLSYPIHGSQFGGVRRPASSLYSRYTNCAPSRPELGQTPPVPPLPLFANGFPSRNSAGTVFEEDTDHQIGHRDGNIEGEEQYLQLHSTKRLTSQSHLPTPRRSRGWWNVVTSPFSPGSKSNAPFWRSPTPIDEDDDRKRMLDDASEISMDLHAGVIFTNRLPGDDELRSAVVPDTQTIRPAVPQRSDTAPAAIYHGAEALDIYRVPSQGLAAAYYDPNQRFPSIILGSLNGWSPSHSVAHPERDFVETDDITAAPLGGHTADKEVLPGKERSGRPEVGGMEVNATALKDEIPPADVYAARSDAAHGNGPRNIFTSPMEEELNEPTPGRPNAMRNDTNATFESSYFSPSTPTPIVEKAYVATCMGPQTSNGELREVQLTPARGRSPQHAVVADTPSTHKATEALPYDLHVQPISEKVPYRPSLHSRTDSSASRVLGISDGEKELYPPPKALLLQPRLGTDRFGQLTMRSLEDDKPRVPWYRRLFWLLASIIAVLLLGLVVLLVVLIPQSHHDMAVEAEWLNLTGFPAMPTGVATIIQPSIAKTVSGCVNPDRLWTCGTPSGLMTNGESDSGLPDFRFEIRFKNGSVPKNASQLAQRSSMASQASGIVRRSTWTDLLFSSNPAAPSKDDELFLGQYTDNVTLPYNGERTPFHISLLDPSMLVSHGSTIINRQASPYPNLGTTNLTNATTTSGNHIPEPALDRDGKPVEPVLYPYARSQPLRLFNRGRKDEHYGFYTYYDRSLFVSNISSNSSTADGFGSASTNVALEDASAVCTFSQTRLHVQIWTQQDTVATLGNPIPLKGLPAANATANDMAGLGSFPYPVTITLDRHGGIPAKKGVFCYGLNKDKRVVESNRMWVDEDRAFGGSLVNAAMAPSNANIRRDDAGADYGGVDGGDGGCACQWQTGHGRG